MANNIHQGAMHWLRVTYEGEPYNVKIRPVLILHIDSDGSRVYYYQVTTQEGLAHQRKYRPLLRDWKYSGLKSPSYIKLKDPPQVACESDFGYNSYIGDITRNDATRMMEYLNGLEYI